MESRPAATAYNTREELVEFCQRRGILVNSYCPIGGRGNKGQSTDELLKDKTLVAIGASHGKTAAQVILPWHLHTCSLAYYSLALLTAPTCLYCRLAYCWVAYC